MKPKVSKCCSLAVEASSGKARMSTNDIHSYDVTRRLASQSVYEDVLSIQYVVLVICSVCTLMKAAA